MQTNNLSELMDNNPTVSSRLTERLQTFIASQPEPRRLDLELASMAASVGVNDHGTVVVSVHFMEGERVIGECHFDGATLGLHCVAGEVLAIEGDDQ